MSAVLETIQLNKRYGRIHAVNDLNLRVDSGQVFGLLGPNGSGKTTTLGMLLGVTMPTSGRFTWYGEPGSHTVRKRVGAILERPVFYPYMSAEENLGVVCLIKDVSRKQIDPALELVGLLERKNDPFKTYSLGMKQRLAIASAMLCDPGVLILDEPTNGLDPQGIADIRIIIRQIASTGKTIILASHLLDEVQKVCSDFCVLSRGRLLYTGNVADDLNADNTFVVASGTMDALTQAASHISFVLSAELGTNGLLLRTTAGTLPETINRAFFDQGIVLSHLSAGKRSLEEKFLNILNEDHDPAATH